MQADITLGQYLPGKSAVHRLDPRTKILLMILYITMIFLITDRGLKGLILFTIPAALLAFMFYVAEVPASYILSSLKPVKWLLVFMFVINVFFTKGDTVLLSIWKIRIAKESLLQALFIMLRLVLLIAGASMLTLTTSPIALTDGLEKLLSPLKKIGFPAHELAMVMTIALRFIPTLLEETDRIRKAQTARGADFESGNLIERAKSMIPILVPLFVSAFRRADELAMAMESRCYHGGDGRTRMRELRYARRDLAAFLIFLAVTALLILLQIIWH